MSVEVGQQYDMTIRVEVASSSNTHVVVVPTGASGRGWEFTPELFVKLAKLYEPPYEPKVGDIIYITTEYGHLVDVVADISEDGLKLQPLNSKRWVKIDHHIIPYTKDGWK